MTSHATQDTKRNTGQIGRTGNDDGPVPGMASLRDVPPPASLVAAVMQRLDQPAPPPGFWAWLRQPRRLEIRVSPLGALASTLLVVVLVSMGVAGPARAPIVMVPASSSVATETVLVRFVLEAKGARNVALAGDFNGWSTEEHVLLDPDQDGRFATTVALPPGEHRYMFVVDGEWITDPGAESRRPDGFGRQNAILRL